MNAGRRLPAVALVFLGLAVVWVPGASAQFAPEPGTGSMGKRLSSPASAPGEVIPAPAGAVRYIRPQPPAAPPAAQPSPPAHPSPPAQPSPSAQPAPQPQRQQPYSYGNSPYYHRPWSYGNPPYYQRPPVVYYPYFYVPRAYGYYGYYGYYGADPYPIFSYPPLIYNWTPFGFQRVY